MTSSGSSAQISRGNSWPPSGDRWAGPVKSGYGLHLVYISNFDPARDPSLDEVRQRVTSEWLAQRRVAATDELYDRLADKYVIEIEPLREEPGS